MISYQSNLKQNIILRRVIQGMIIFGIFLMAITPINHENDIFWQIRMGEEIWENQSFPVKDPYSHAGDGIWTLHEWLPSLSFYIVNKHFGSAGLIIFKAIIITLTFTFFMILFNRLKANLYLSLSLFVLAMLVNTRGVWVVFPSIFEYLFLVITIFLLEVYRQNKKNIIPFLLIALSFIWSNSHGSFFLLPVILGIYIIGSLADLRFGKPVSFTKNQLLKLGIVIVVSLFAPLFTPNGYLTYLYPFRITFGKFSSYVNEYQRFWTVWQGNWSDFVHGFALILMLSLLIVFILAFKKLHLTDLILALFFTALALSAVRHVAIFALVALYLLVRYLTIWFGEYRGIFRRSMIKDLLVIAFIICFVFYYKTKVIGFGLNLSEEGYPKEAAELINDSNLEGNMFNHYNYGGYLIWKMPKYKVFIDGRLEMYQGQAGVDYMTILLAKPGYKELLNKYNINFFIMDLRDQIVEFLLNDPDWKYIYHDSQYVVFVKDRQKNADFLSQNFSGEKQEAFKQNYQQALGISRSDQFIQKGVGSVKANDLTEALASFEQAVKYYPGSVSARLNLAQVLVDLDMFQEAKAEYEFVLANLDGDNSVAKEGLERVNQWLK